MVSSHMAEQIGRVLGDRYRLLAPVGRGASAQVFVADDVRLRRRVAVKVLHEALADDQEFLRRFRAEAQAAAALNHPHVMAVYDWGQDGEDSPWIVTELLGGGSLRALLDRGHRLTPSQALVVGLQAVRGLDYAHRRGFVHRDVKPANLLFDDEGRLRIADFGLARALAEAAWTEPQGAVVGTARYASPEQAQGSALTGRADVYSLALVLVEAVTGTVPFATDTTLGTLMARVGTDLVAPEDLGPLGQVVEAAGRSEPEDRLDARELGDALARVAAELPRPAPLPLAGALAEDLSPDRDPTHMVGGAVSAGTEVMPDEAEVEVGAGPGPERSEGQFPDGGDVAVGGALPLTADPALSGEPRVAGGAVDGGGSRAPVVGPGTVEAGLGDEDGRAGSDDGPDQDVTVVASTAVVDPTVVDPGWAPAAPALFDAAEDDEWDLADEDDGDGGPWDPRSPTGRRRRWPWAFVVLLLAGVGVAVGLLVSDLAQGTPTHQIPDVAGSTEVAARSALGALGYEVEVEREHRDGTEVDDVLGTRPPARTELAEGELVVIVVSDGPPLVDLPDLPQGLPRAEAQARLAGAGLVMVAEERFHEEVEEGQLIEVLGSPPARPVKGTEVGVAVSIGPEPRVVPERLAGTGEGDVVAILEGMGLVPDVRRVYDDDVAVGVVMSTDPGAGSELPRGAPVAVVVSLGPDLVTVPDVRGTDSPREAAALLEAAGLEAADVRGPATGFPAGTSPAAGERVRRGSEVDIILQRRSGDDDDD